MEDGTGPESSPQKPRSEPAPASDQQSQLDRLRQKTDALGKTLRRLRDRYDLAPVGYVTMDPSTAVLETNVAAARMLRVPRDDLVGVRLSQFLDADDLLPFLRYVSRVFASDDPGAGEFRFPIGSAEPRWFRLEATRSEDDERPFCRLVLIDVTDSRRSEQARTRLEKGLLESRKMEAIGRFARGIAHNFNNLLLVIVGSAEGISLRMKREGTLDRRASDDVDRIATACDTAAGLVQALTHFASSRDVQFEVIDLNRVLERLDKLILGSLPDNVRYESTCSDESMRIWTNEARLEQCIMNLVQNGCDAMPDGGTLTLACGPAAFDPVTDPGPGGIAATWARGVVIEIRDTGAGMDRATVEKVFEPFFTTKPAGQGAGLGLAKAYALVTASGGRIDVSSEVGQGATFRLTFPVADERLGGSSDGAADALHGAGETIVLCDDEQPVREMLGRFLGEIGYTVLEAADGDEALRLASAPAASVDLLIADLVMPGMRGDALARRFTVAQPDAGILFISGRAGPPHAAEAIEERGWLVLNKPFGLRTLMRRIREVLDARGQAKE